MWAIFASEDDPRDLEIALNQESEPSRTTVEDCLKRVGGKSDILARNIPAARDTLAPKKATKRSFTSKKTLEEKNKKARCFYDDFVWYK